MTPLLPALVLLAPAQPPALDFNRDVRPILADHCFQCHGPDAANRKGRLRLDLDPTGPKRDPVLIAPGDPAASELIRRVTSADKDERMPPADFARPLAPKQVETLKAWVKQGGKWASHWALVPPVRPPVPKIRNPKSEIRNEIDAFVFARLEKEGLSPAPEADRATLIRRMSFDLTGLPPTPAEVDAFLADAAPGAVGRLADRLLTSPRYGERMAWRWLDAARYADTNGYQTDAERDMWRWRDWVIEAYNRNLPFDRFTVEQLAGDLLPNPTLDQRVATGFNRNHRGNSEGGIVPEEYAVEYVADRVETTGTVWLGLTFGCARCHDHKYDPVSQREFYQLFAYFNNVPEKGRAVKFGNSPPLLKAPTREQQQQLAALDALIAFADKTWAARVPKAEQAQAEWERTAGAATAPEWTPTRGLLKEWAPGPPLAFDGEKFATAAGVGDFGYDDRFTIAAWVNPRGLTAPIVSRGPDEAQAEGYAVELVGGRVRVSLTKRWLDDALRVETAPVVADGRGQHVAVTYDGSRLAAGVRVYVNGVEQKTTVLLDELNQTFQSKEPFRVGAGGGGRFRGFMKEVRVYGRVLDGAEVALLAEPVTVAGILGTPPGDRTPRQRDKLRAAFLDRHAPAGIVDAHRAPRTLREERARFWDALPTVMVMEELPAPRDAFVLVRGEYDKRGARVAPGVPAALPPLPKGAPNNRLGFARWLVDPANPLTARVAVNRMWQLHFGTGLVRTGEDFGTQGEHPTHPELLDWLATEFARDWDVKRMHKLIVTSAVYRQSSRMTPALRERDPENKLLARGPRLRLSAEMLRDQALFAAGLLVERQGGPSVKPYQPAGLWSELSGAADYAPDTGANLYRRSLYTFWKRSVPPPTLGVFDAATRETCWVRETRTNTPLHALTLLNDVTFVEAARVLAQRVVREEAAPAARLARAFRHLTARPPTEAEARVLLGALERQLAVYRADPAAAARLLRVGASPPGVRFDAAELAAYATVCGLVMNLDEAVTKE